MAFFEIWFILEINIEDLEIFGYNMVSDDRIYLSGGGEVFYLKDGYDF